MERLTGKALHELLYVAIRTAPKPVTSRLRAKLPHEGDKAAGDLARLIVAKIDNDSRMVISADPVANGPYGQQPGKWGVTEPDPTA